MPLRSTPATLCYSHINPRVQLFTPCPLIPSPLGSSCCFLNFHIISDISGCSHTKDLATVEMTLMKFMNTQHPRPLWEGIGGGYNLPPSSSIAIDLRQSGRSQDNGLPTPQQQAPDPYLVCVRETKPTSNYHLAASVGDRCQGNIKAPATLQLAEKMEGSHRQGEQQFSCKVNRDTSCFSEATAKTCESPV